MLVLVLTLVLPGCVPQRTTTTTTPATATDQDRIASLESKVSSLNQKISDLQNSENVADFQPSIDVLSDELDALRDDFQGMIDDLQTQIDELGTSDTTDTSSDVSPEDAVEIGISQPYMTYTVPELAVGGEYAQTFLLTMTLENTLSVAVNNIIIMATVYPYTSRQYSSLEIVLTGGILFNPYSSGMFQSWGPLSLKAEQKKIFQLTVNVVLRNTGTTPIGEGTLTVPVQAYCIDYDS